MTVSARANDSDVGGLIRLVEWRLVATLLAHIGEVVPRDDLTGAAWPGKRAKDGTLSVSMKRVRSRIEPLGLSITTVRGRGLVISADGRSATSRSLTDQARRCRTALAG